MNKNAILLASVAKIILAVLGLILLIYLAFSLIQIFVAKNQLEQARAHLDTIVNNLELLEEQGGGSKDYILLNPKDWVLSGWPSDFEVYTVVGSGIAQKNVWTPYGADEIPKECKRNNWESCLCFCQQAYGFQSGLMPLEGCDEFGICVEIKKEFFMSASGEDKRDVIWVNKLIDNRKPLTISLKDDIVRIYPKSD